ADHDDTTDARADVRRAAGRGVGDARRPGLPRAGLRGPRRAAPRGHGRAGGCREARADRAGAGRRQAAVLRHQARRQPDRDRPGGALVRHRPGRPHRGRPGEARSDGRHHPARRVRRGHHPGGRHDDQGESPAGRREARGPGRRHAPAGPEGREHDRPRLPLL
ncbi:MAG: hypothetical protein AVDCRST_MAG06-3379, partial [uncultured Nocardioides sp.]